MKFRYHSAFNDPGLQLGYTKVLQNVMSEIDLVEQLGFDGIWLGEHHLGPEGLANLPNPILLQAHIAARTNFATYGLCCVIAPTWHPIRLAEDIAVLDHLTRGRLHIGFARGVFPRDTAPFHPNADCRSEASRGLTSEVIDLVLKALKEDFFAHEGPNYKFPPPGIAHHPWSMTEEPYVDDDGTITKLCIVPKAVQRPHPPVWVMASQASSARLAAELGYNCMAAGSALDLISDWLDLYQEIRSKKEGRDLAKGEGWSIQKPLYVARTMEQARNIFEPYVYKQRQYQALYRENPSEYVTATLGKGAASFDWDTLQETTAILAGPPDHVGEQIEKFRALGITAMNVWTDVGGLPHELTMEALALFGEEVMPAISSAE